MARSQKAFLGIDIGGTKIEGILWRSGKILRVQKLKTPKNRQKFLSAVFDLIESLRKDVSAAGIGIALAGATDLRTGKVIHSPNLPFINGLNLKKLLEARFAIPVRVDNDSRCFLRGEINFGSSKEKKNVVGMIIGTGVGGALYLEGKMIYGKHGFAGEQGMAKLIVGKSILSIEDLVSSHGFKRLGGKRSAAVYRKVGKYLGLHLANLVEIFNPELIIIGGGVTDAGSQLLRPALAEMRRHVVFPKQFWPQIRFSKLKHAGALGAISLFK